MSYKRKPENIAFSVAITPDKRKKFENEDTSSVAVLAPFNPFPKVSFENIKLHSTAVREVYLVNPTENAIQVEVTKLPDEARGYHWSATEFELPKESQAKLIITWTPSEYGSWHDNVKIVNQKTKKTLSELKLSSTTGEPPKQSKRGLRASGAVSKKQTNSSKQEVLKKCTTNKQISENKENELTFISKCKKQSYSTTCLKNENVIIYESKKPLHSKTFTQIKEDDLDDQQSNIISETIITHSVATITSTQDLRKLQLGPSTPRRGTFDAMKPVVSSRRSTYSLRNRQITNIIDVEKEKKEFELLASPGTHNESLEIAASRLVNRNAKEGLSSVDEAEPLEAGGCSKTFTIQPSVTYNVVKAPSSLSSVTFNVLEVSSSPSYSMPLQQSPIGDQLMKDKCIERLSLETVSSDNFYDSLEERQSLDSLERRLISEVEKNADLPVDWDEIYDLDKFTSKLRGSNKKKSSFTKQKKTTDESLESQQRNREISHCRETVSEHAQASSSNLLESSSYKNITQRRKQSNTSSTSPLNCKNVFDSLDNLILPKDLNQTKDTIMQLDEDFGHFNFSIASSSPVNLQNAVISNLNRTYTPAKSNLLKTNSLDKFCEENPLRSVLEKAQSLNFNEGYSNFSGYSKDLNTSKTDLAGEKVNQVENYRTELKTFSEEYTPSNGTMNNNSSEPRSISKKVQSDPSLLRTQNWLNEQHPEISSDSKHPPLIWNISPPTNSKDEEDISRKITPYNLPKLKTTPSLQTPVRLTRAKSSLSYLASKTNVSQLKDQHSSQASTNCKNTSEPLCSKENNNAGIDNPNNRGVYSEEVFLRPSTRIKRRSSLKTTNGSPPKLKKTSQELKIKRLSTPSVPRKLTLSARTEVRKKCKAEVPRSLPRSAKLIKKRESLKVAEWVPIPRKLRLSCVSSQSEEDVSPSPVDLATPDPFLAATTLNPFAKGGLYFNKKWLKEQEVELIQWADRMLRPPNELELDRDQSERSTLHRLNALRATAFSILTSTEVATVLSKVKVAVDRNIISIRSDRQLHADLGLQDKIIGLLMSYNPLWLRLCLEVVYQCNIQLRCHSDESGLRDFIRRYVLNDEYLRETYSHPTIPYLMQPEFEDEMKKFTVYKFLVLVYLLDLVKSKKVILHDPCLLKRDSKLKSSKEILIDFNKDFVAGAGDITRILRMRGYEVSHCQTYIDEFDFSLTDTTELRDGVRLTRLAENLVGDNSLCSKLRVPAVSNLQKKFNAEVAFTSLKKAGYDLHLDVCPKDISDGHKEKTLSFLWHLRGIIQKRAVVIIITKWRETKQLRQDRKTFLNIKRSVVKIQRWYRKIKQAGSLSDEQVKKGLEERENFVKLRAVVVQLQRRFRKKKEKRDFQKKCQAAAIIQNWYRSRRALLNDRNQFKALRKAAMTIQRALKNYKSKKNGSALAERVYFLKIRAVTIMVQRRFRFIQLAKHQRHDFLAIQTAAIKIQRRFRANKQAKKYREHFLTIKRATLTIQRRFKALLLTKQQRQDFLRMKTAATAVQTRFRALKHAENQRKEFLKIKNSTVVIQRKYRAILIAKYQRKYFLAMKAASIMIQRRYRAKKETEKCRKEFLTIKVATIKLQKRIRAFLVTKSQRKQFLEKKTASIIIQRRYRANKLVKSQRKHFLSIKAAAVAIQRRFRANKQGKKQREHFLTIKSAAVIIQRRFRGYLLTKNQSQAFLAKKTAAITIQRRYRANKLVKSQRKHFLSIKAAAVAIQRRFRANKQGKKQREHFLTIKSAAVIIQRRFRGYILTKNQSQAFLVKKTAAVTIQRRFRANQQAKQQRELFIIMKTAIITIQRRFRAHLLAKEQRQDFLTMKAAAIIVQRRYRAIKLVKSQRKHFLSIKAAAVAIQRQFRANKQGKKQRKHFLAIKSAAVIIQRRFRGYLLTKNLSQAFHAKKTASVTIQRIFRANKQAKHQRELFIVMKTAVVTIQRRFRDHMLAKQQRQDFLTMKAAAIAVQRRYRGSKLAKRQREEFITVKTAVVKIQRRFRTFQLAKQQRQAFLLTKTATIKVQRIFRANKKAKTQRQDFLALRSAAGVIQRRFKANMLAKYQREKFISIKTATVIIQRRFKAFLTAKQQRQDFLEMKTAVLTIQRFFRAYRLAKYLRKRFLAVKTATVTIQRRFRALHLAKEQRDDFIQVKTATVTIQRRFRANKQANCQRELFIGLKTAAITIQRRFRNHQLAKQQRQEFLLVKTAAIVIQRRYRGCKLAKQQQKEFISIKTAVIKIQKRFRTFQLAKQQRNNFLSTKTAAITVQRIFRANNKAKIQRKHFLNMKNAAVIIQTRFRASILAKRERHDFLAMKAAAITIQRRFKANKLAKSQREYFLVLRRAAITIQTRFVAFLFAKHQRLEFLKKRTAVLTIQRKFRAYKQAKVQREEFLALKNVTITIQRRFRAWLTVKHQRQEFLSVKVATITIQRRFRAMKITKDQRQNFIRLRTAAISIQRKFRENQKAKTTIRESVVARNVNAAVRIQAAWRGYLVRKTITVPQPPKVKPTGLETSTDNDQIISIRGQRYFKVLSNHRRYSVAELQNTLFNVDKITLLSANQCEYFVRNGAVKILYEILEHQSNKALGVHKCVELILSILLNLYRAPVIAEIVWRETREANGIFYVFDLMMRFKTEKTSTVFCKACTVIWLFAQDPVKAQVMIKTPKIEAIYKYVVKSLKKSEQPGPSGCKRSEQSRLSSKKPVSGTRKKFPALRFNWGNYFDDHRAFDDKSVALDSVVEKFDRFVKL